MLQVKTAVGKVMGSKVYGLSDGISNDYYFIDIGDFDAARSILPMGANVLGAFITHGHHDHITGINALKKAFSECKVYASGESVRMLASEKANLSLYVDTPISYDGDVSILHDGDNIKLYDGIYLDVIATPGHNPSCFSFIVENYLFTGDSFIPDIKVVTNLPGGDKTLSKNSLSLIVALSKDRIICPGH